MRRKAFKKIKQMRGGGDGYIPGIDVNDVSEFSPAKIPDLVLWVTADPTKLVYSTIQDYVLNFPPSIANHILDQYKTNPSEKVIVEIQSNISTLPNSLVRLELDTESAVGFPNFVTRSRALDIIDMSNLLEPSSKDKQIYKLATKSSVSLSLDFSSWIISKNVKIEYIDLIEKIVLSTPYFDTPTTTLLEDGKVAAIPTAEFSEVIVYSRKLADDETAMLDGYVAYRKNEQYLLKSDNPYFPSIDSLPFLQEIAKPVQETEQSLQIDLESFDKLVSEYRAKLPNDPILNSASSIKENAIFALKEISELRKNITRGGLLSRKRGTETVDSVFQSMADLSLYTPPLTQEGLSSKISEISVTQQKLEAYMKSLGSVDEIKTKVDAQNSETDQINQMTAAHNLEQLQQTQTQTQMREIYNDLRKKSDEMNAAGSTYYNSLVSDFTKQIKTMNDVFQYYVKDTESRWNTLMGQFNVVDTQISSGTWLTYIPSLDTSVVSETKRGDAVISIQYTDLYLNQIQTIYEQVRNQIKEGDFAFIKEEIIYHAATISKFYKNLQNNKVNPFCKKTFLPFFKKNYETVESYANEFETFYSVFTDAISTLSTTLSWNQENQKAAKITKTFPIAITYKYSKTVNEYFIRKLNRYDNTLTMIEYIFTYANGTILYAESEEKDVHLFFPSLERVNKHDQDIFYTKKTPFIDNDGRAMYQKYTVLEPYESAASILDALPESMVLPKSFHVVNSIYELVRQHANSIYELSVESPQRPILLPKYAMKVGSFYICVNVGKLPLQIQISDYFIDTLGPGEICMYNYLGKAPDFYGRKFWNPTRIAYDTLLDVPRSSLCLKITELSKFIYMREEDNPLFDKNGFLIEATPDSSGNIYDMDDVYHSRPYSITVGDEKHLSDVSIHAEWGEKMIVGSSSVSIIVSTEGATGFPVFCSKNGTSGIDEFGYCKYVLTPMLHMHDSIRTSGSGNDPIQIQLNTAQNIVQYGMIPAILSFQVIFRSMFVKPSNQNGYIFINSSNYPIISPQNTYINVDNPSLMPPYLVYYVDFVKQIHAYIPKNTDLAVPNTISLPVSSCRFIDISKKAQELSDRNFGVILAYRYKVDKSYIKYLLSVIEIKYEYCKTYTFDETKDTLSLLQQCYTEIEKYLQDFSAYSSNINALEIKQTTGPTNKQIKLAIDTIDINMKDILQKVFASFTKADNAIQFFTKIIQSIDAIKKSVKRLREVIIPENEKSVLEIQGQIQKDKQIQGNPSSSDLSDVLKTMINLKVDFETRLRALEKNADSIPKFLVDVDTWIQTQQILINKEYEIRKEIIQIVNTNLVDVYTRRIKNASSSTLSEIKGVRNKADDYLSYKKTIALWLEIWSVQTDVSDYSKKPFHPASNNPFKGYSITFPVFEEISNPLISRDWKSLLDNTKISDSLRSRISLELILPIQNFVTANRDFYNVLNDTDSIPTIMSLENTPTDNLKTVLTQSKTTMDGLVANAITIEGELLPIFENYKKIRSDLRTEFQKMLEDQATNIQQIWTDITGQKTAIQTSIQILQDYFTSDQENVANSILKSMDEIIPPDIFEKVEKIQQSVKAPDFYTNIPYIKMAQTLNEWNDLISSLKKTGDQIQPIQTEFNNFQSDVLTHLQNSIATAKNTINDSIVAAKVKYANTDSSLQTIQDTIQPKVDDMMNRTTDTISDCISVNTKIQEINNELQTLNGG